MAKVFSHPEGMAPPEIDFTDRNWYDKEKAYIDRLAEAARAAHAGQILPRIDLIGSELRFPRGDGHALYIVWCTKPLQLVWVQVGDAWHADPILLRGLRLSDVEKRVDAERRFAALSR